MEKPGHDRCRWKLPGMTVNPDDMSDQAIAVAVTFGVLLGLIVVILILV